MHDFIWRLDIDLNGADDNSAYWTRHEEKSYAPLSASATGSTAEDNRDPI